eukprot:363060-Chlamydomonas_euryale.AAC.8
MGGWRGGGRLSNIMLDASGSSSGMFRIKEDVSNGKRELATGWEVPPESGCQGHVQQPCLHGAMPASAGFHRGGCPVYI